MKSLRVFSIILFVSVNVGFSQSFSLGDMLTLASYENWSDANTFLINRGWEYYGSEGSDGFSDFTVTWSFERSSYDGTKATAWVDWSMINLLLYTTPYVKIQVHTQESYKKIHGSLSSYGFRLDETEVKEGKAVSTYKTDKYTLYESTKSSDDYYSGPSNIYVFELYMNFEYSPSQNGFKKEYFDDSNQMKASYTLVKGKMHGIYTEYNERGDKIIEATYVNGVKQGKYFYYNSDDGETIKSIFINGKRDGQFVVYNNNDKKIWEGFFKQDSLHGKRIQYDEEGRITSVINFNMGIMDGPAEYDYYIGDTIVLKSSGNFKNDLKEGKWNYSFSNLKSKKVISTMNQNFKNGELDGPCVEFSNDSLVYSNYRNGKLHGKYEQFIDLNHLIFGGIPSYDSSKCEIQSEGWYENGVKTGYWRYYSYGRDKLLAEGYYQNDQKEGKWDVYNTTVYQCRNLDSTYEVDFGHLLLRTETYKNGLLNGPTQYYYLIDSETYKCKNIHTPDDSCYRATLNRVDIVINYKDDLRNGLYCYKGENGELISQGNYTNDKKDGMWREHIDYSDNSEGYVLLYYSKGIPDGAIEYYDSNGKIQIKGNYKAGEKNGEWSYFGEKTVYMQKTYTWDKLNGPSRYFSDLGVLYLYENYQLGELDSIACYDETNPGTVLRTHKIFSNTGSQFVSRIRIYKGDTTEIQTQTIIDDDYGWDSEGTLNGFYSILIDQKTIIQGQFKNGYKDGNWYYYLYDQGIYVISKYNNDELQSEEFFSISTKELYKGKVKLYDLFSNTDYEVFSVKEGKRNGTTTIYKNNEKVEKKKYKMGVLQE